MTNEWSHAALPASGTISGSEGVQACWRFCDKWGLLCKQARKMVRKKKNMMLTMRK